MRAGGGESFGLRGEAVLSSEEVLSSLVLAANTGAAAAAVRFASSCRASIATMLGLVKPTAYLQTCKWRTGRLEVGNPTEKPREQ